LTINNINIDETLKSAKEHLAEEKEMLFAMKSLMELLLLVISLLVERLNLDSRNSSKPPSQDPNRKKISKEGKANNKGGQKGHAGKT
jgi:transposase